MTETKDFHKNIDEAAMRQMEQRLEAVGEYFRRNVLSQILRDLDDVDTLVTRLGQRIQREIAGQIVDSLGRRESGGGLSPSRGEALSGLAELLGKAQRYL